MCSLKESSRRLLAGASLCGLAMIGGCTGDAAMDTSLAGVTGALFAAATGDYSTAQQLASLSQSTYSQSMTGAYRYDNETQGQKSSPTSATASSPSAPTTNNAVLPASYGADVGDLGVRVETARGALGANCPSSLGYLDPVLPRFSDAQLAGLRSTVVTASVDTTLAEYRAQGATPNQAALAMRNEYNSSLELAEEAVQTFRATTGGDPNPLLEQIRDGTYPFLPSEDGMQDNSARAIVMAWYRMFLTLEMALALGCHGAIA